MAFWKTLVVIGVLSLLAAAFLIGIGVYESTAIPTYRDPPVGESLIIPLIGFGLIAIGYGIAYKRQG